MSDEVECGMDGEFSKIIREISVSVEAIRMNQINIESKLDDHIEDGRVTTRDLFRQHNKLKIQVAAFESGGCPALKTLNDKVDEIPGKMTTRISVGFAIMMFVLAAFGFFLTTHGGN